MARRQPERRPDPVQWLLVRYSKTGPARFASHRDIARAFERVLRRAEVPIAYSSGFSPHPRVSYANPAPTGAASLAEYLLLGMAEKRGPGALAGALNEQMPAGLAVVSVAEVPGRGVADLFHESTWRIEVTPAGGSLTEAVARLLAVASYTVERETHKGKRVLDVRAPLRSLAVEDGAIVVTIIHTEPLVRPEDVLTALQQLCPELGLSPQGAVYTRLGQR
jgi:radical SAM-linked protein